MPFFGSDWNDEKDDDGPLFGKHWLEDDSKCSECGKFITEDDKLCVKCAMDKIEGNETK